MNPILYNRVRKYLYDCLDLAIYNCDADCREWYLTATYKDCRSIFVEELWTEDESESYDGFNLISDKVREADVEDITCLFEEVKRDVLANEYDVQFEMTLIGWHVIFFYGSTPLKIEVNGTRIEIDMDITRFRYRLEDKEEAWITPEYTIRIENKE